MLTFTTLIHSALFHGAVIGFGTAAVTDLHACLKSWTNWKDVVTYDWGTASFRWFQGIVMGVLGAAGLNVAGL